MAKANRQLKKAFREIQWRRGLRISVSQGQNTSEIWQCENGIWATYFGPKGDHKPQYLSSFSASIDYILNTASEAGIKLDGLKKSLIRETELAIDRNLLPSGVMALEAVEVGQAQSEWAQEVHERAKAGQLTGLDKYDGSPDRGSCSCC
mgnify:CR=1 FL=1